MNSIVIVEKKKKPILNILVNHFLQQNTFTSYSMPFKIREALGQVQRIGYCCVIILYAFFYNQDVQRGWLLALISHSWISLFKELGHLEEAGYMDGFSFSL